MSYMPFSEALVLDEFQWPKNHTPGPRRRRERSLSSGSDCTLGREDEPEVLELFGDEVIDLTCEDQIRLHVDPLEALEFPLGEAPTSAGHVQVGSLIEIENKQLGQYPVQFLEVHAIIQQQAGGNVIRGIPFTRTRNLKAKLPKKTNELCKILHFNRNSTPYIPLMIDISATSVIRKRRLIYSNSLWPENSFVTKETTRSHNKEQRALEIENTGTLVCRWKLQVFFKTQGRTTKPDEQVLERIQYEELSDHRYGTSDDVLCNRWRGGRQKGGSWYPYQMFHLGSIDLDGIDGASAPNQPKPRRKYTLFDSFSGAGGVSRGAQAAGLRVEYAVDHEPAVWQTYEANFPDAKLYKTSIDGFIQASRSTPIRVDFLHLSPPCQYFSPAHTRESSNDDANIFALFGCSELINKLRPRIITLEQTFGITHERHLQYLQLLIGDLTQFGYSVRWKVVRLSTWGSAQDRKRLIVLAAGPGEKLPPFPPATHSANPADGLKPLRTIGEAVRDVRPGDSLHDLQNVKYYRPPRPPYDANQLGMTITTGCDQMYFPDGTRDFTLREYASLQGFPRQHQFMGTKTAVKRQIGNAFPPNTVHVLYSFLRRWLEKEDGIRSQALSGNEIIALDEPSESPGIWATETDAVRAGRRRYYELTTVVNLT